MLLMRPTNALREIQHRFPTASSNATPALTSHQSNNPVASGGGYQVVAHSLDVTSNRTTTSSFGSFTDLSGQTEEDL